MHTTLKRAVVAASAVGMFLITLSPASARLPIDGGSPDPETAPRIVTSADTPFDAAGTIIAKATRNIEVEVEAEDTSKLMWPVEDTINTPFTGEHAGIDIEGETGDPIVAAASGVITFAGDDGDGYGTKVVIRHDNEISTLYSHLLDIKVSKGRIDRGELVGTVGCTGSCSGDHLHFEVLKNGTPTNPLDYLKN